MSVFLDDCSGDVDCVFFFDGGGSPNVWQSSVLPVGSVPPKSLFYLFVHTENVPSIPLESVFALTPLISEGRFHIVKTPYPHSTSILLGFYVGILHCHSSPEVRFMLVTKDQAVDIVVDQLSQQGRTIQRIPADSFSSLFSSLSSSSSTSTSTSISSSSSSSSTISRPSSAASAASGMPVGVLSAPSALLSSSPPTQAPSGPQISIPTATTAPPLKSPVPTSVQSDAEIIQELSTTENFNKKTKKRIVTKITNRKDLQIALINKLLESSNVERALFICTQFGLQSLFPTLSQPLPPPQSTTVPPPPQPVTKNPSPTTPTSANKHPSPLHTHPSPLHIPLPQPTQSHPPQEVVAASPQLTLEIPQTQLPQMFPDDMELSSPSQQSVQELQQILRRQTLQQVTHLPDPLMKASPKKKTQPAKAAKPAPTTPKKSASDSASPNILLSPTSNPSPSNSAQNSKTSETKKGSKTPTKPLPQPFSSPLTVPVPLSTNLVISSTTSKQPIPNHPVLTIREGNADGQKLTYKNAAAIKAIYTRILSHIYPANSSEIRMEWDEPIEAALQCLAHMNVTEQHDDPEARFLVQLLLATMLESGLTVARRAQQGQPFSLQEHAVVIHETWKLLSHWGYSSDTLSMFEDIYMNNPEYFAFTKSKTPQIAAFPFVLPSHDKEDFERESTGDEQAWVEGWNARRIISNPSGEL